MITQPLISLLRRDFALDWRGVHGAPHWARVHRNGRALAQETGARLQVVELFAFLHDARRQSEGPDPGHGQRAAAWVPSLNGAFFDLSTADLDLLVRACAGHSDGRLTADLTVQVCWDADRLDLGRVGIQPDPDRLCTDAARALLGRRSA